MGDFPSQTRDHPAHHSVPPPAKKPTTPTPPTTITANDLIVPPTKPPAKVVVGGDAIPIGIQITSEWLKKIIKAALPSSKLPSSNQPIALSAAVVELKWNKTAIATVALGKPALAVIEANKAFQFSTRLRVKTAPNKPATGTLGATAKLTPVGEKELPPIIAELPLEVQYSDCTAARVNQLFMSVQPVHPKSADVISVKSFVPASASRKINTIQCAFDAPAAAAGIVVAPSDPLPDYVVISVGLDTDASQYLAEEIFVGFDFTTSKKSGLMAMSWRYDSPNPLTASAYIDPVDA
jgi:hypothetical protein